MSKSRNKIFCEVCNKEYSASVFMRHMKHKGESHLWLLQKIEDHRKIIETYYSICCKCGGVAGQRFISINEAMCDIFCIKKRSQSICKNKSCKTSWNAGLTKETNDIVKRIGLMRRGENNPIHVIMNDIDKYAAWIENCKKGAEQHATSRRGKTYDEFFGEEKSIEIKSKLSDAYARREIFPNAGNKHTEETKEKIAHKVALYWAGRQGRTSKPQLLFYQFLSDSLPQEKIILEHVYGKYSIDIALPEYKVAIEVDGDFFHVNELMGFKPIHPIQQRTIKNDLKKNAYLKKAKWVVLRFWVSDIEKDKECILQKIIKQIISMK